MARGESGAEPTTSVRCARQREVELVRARVREAASGRPGALLVRGVHGVGKSTLVSLIGTALRDEALVLSATCARGDADFTVARALLGGAADVALAGADDDRTRLQRLRKLAFDRITDRPLVLLLDDAHLCDEATARWMCLLARRAVGARMFVVLAVPRAEHDVADPRFAELTAVLDTTVLDLEPLPELVKTADPGADEAAAHWAAWIAAQSETVRRYATAVAIIGDGAGIAPIALFELSSAAAASAHSLLVLSGVLTDEGAFRSQALRTRVLAAVDEEELVASRCRAARLLSDECRPRREIAEQIAELPVLAEPWMVAALRDAASDCADQPRIATRYLRRLLADEPGHLGTRLQLARTLTGFDPAAACSEYLDVLARMPVAQERASIAVRIGMLALTTGQAADVFPVLTDVWRALPAGSDPRQRHAFEATFLMVGHAGLTTVSETLGYAGEIRTPTEITAGASRRLAQQLTRSELLTGKSAARTLEVALAALTPPTAEHDRWDLVPAAALHHCGETAAAEVVIGRVLHSATERGDEDGVAAACTARAVLKLEGGDLEAAATEARQALTVSAGPELIGARTVLALVSAHSGENDRARQFVAEFGEPHGPAEHGWALMARARVLRGSRDLPGALDLLLRCGRDLDEMGVGNPVLVPWWAAAVPLLVELGRTTEAAALAERGADASTRWDTAEARGFALYTKGLVTADLEMLTAAAVRFGAAGRRLHEIQALIDLGTALVRQGYDKAARKQLRTAVELALCCGDIEAANAARTALTVAGGRMSELSVHPSDALTGSERRVADLAAEGRTNREIAEALYVTVSTVEGHLSRIYRKLRVHARADLAAKLR